MGNTICKSKSTLEQYNIHNTNEFTLNNIFTEARVIDIYDGDTCTIIIKFNNIYNKFTVRLNGIDTCEMKAKSAENKKKAYLARDRLLNLVTNIPQQNDSLPRKTVRDLLNREVYLINICITGTDKYGRLLGDLYSLNDVAKTVSFSSILLTEKLAYAYDGKTKKSEIEQIDS